MNHIDNKGIKNWDNQSFDFLSKLIEYVDDVDAILRDVACHYDADRAYVFEFSKDRQTIHNTYEFCKDGVEPQIDALQNLPFESVAIWVEEFEKVGAFYISCLDQDVDENSLTYQILEPQGIDSLITAPIYEKDTIVGFIGVDNPRTNIDDLAILKMTAYILYSEIRRKISDKNKTIKEMEEEQLRYNARLEEICDIIAAANMGIWRIELVDGEEPRMYVDDTMKRLLGIKGKTRSPEKTYDDWFYNITPEAVPSVLNSVERMQQGHFDENTYLWKHPTKGIRYVRCGGTSKPIEGGCSLQGYHYDVDEVERKNQAQMLKLKKALDDKKEYYDTLGALGDIFYSIHVIDLSDDTVDEYSAKNEVKELLNQTNNATKMMAQIMCAVTESEYVEEALEFTDLTTLAERMQDKKMLSAEFVGKHIGWFESSFITMEEDDQKRPTKVIYTTRVIDEQKKQQETLIHKTRTDELTGLLNRRAYEEGIYLHNNLPEEEKFIYISLDANGLKVINDTMGHQVGDEMLIGVSQCMKQCLGSYGNVYRVGGDEFVAILFCDEEEIKPILHDFDRTVAKWSGKLIQHISVSYGWVNKYEFPDATTRELAVIADQRMYDAKSDHYRRKGMDRSGQKEAHKTLCGLYTKILKVDLANDSYQIVNMDSTEKTVEKGFSDSISQWLSDFGKSGQVHPDDLEEYLKYTDIEYIKDYFKKDKTSLHVFYRRKFDDDYKQVMLEMVPANDYEKDHQSLFLYVKNIDK